MCEPTTDELVRLAADGDTEAFADLIPRFHDRLCARVVTTQPLASASGYRLLSGHDSSSAFEPRAV